MAVDPLPPAPAAIDAYIRNQTPYLRGSIIHADQKATFVLLVLTALVAYLESKTPFIDRGAALLPWRGWDSWAAGISLVATTLFTASACCAGAVVWPRFNRREATHSSSFVWIANEFVTSLAFVEHMLRTDEREVLAKQLRAHYYWCRVCWRKWKLLRWAYRCGAAGSVVFAIHFVLAVMHEWKWIP